MSVNLRSLTPHRIVDFSGGINEFDSSFTMKDNELREAMNVELRSGGAIRSRKGSPWYQKQGFLGVTITTPVVNMFRYSRFNGDKQVLMYSGGNVYADDDNGEFTLVQAIAGDDGKCRFAQWRETVFFSTKSDGLAVYDPYDPRQTNALGPGHSPPFTTHLSINGENIENLVPSGGAMIALTPINSANGVLVNGATYLFYYTFDIYQGPTFLGESGVVWKTRFAGPPRIYDAPGAILGPLDDTYEIRSTALLASLPQGYGAINIYRSIAPSAAISTQIETNMVFVGSIPRSRWNDLVTAHIVDDGLFAGRSIAPYYARNERPPYGRFVVTHKSRMWLANVKYESYDRVSGGQIVSNAPHRVYFSEVNEPGVFLSTSWVEIDPTDGDGITGIASFKNKILIVFQANAMWAISGGDDEIGPGIPDVSIENISTDIGCVASESIQICEGRIVWLSHRGVYYYDGTMPKPLKSDNIDGTILDLRTPSRYKDPASIFLSKEREYWVSHASTGETSVDNDQDYQTQISKFSFKNASWVRAEHSDFGGLPVGVASFVEKKDTNRAPIVLAGLEGSTVGLGETVVRYMDVSSHETEDNPIEWSFRTKFYDTGRPYMDKKFVAILVQLRSTTDVLMEVSCDNHLVDEPFTILNTENAYADDELIWDVGDWSDGVTGAVWAGDNNRNALIYLNDKCWGKRISIRFSGATAASPTEIQALTIFFDQKEGVRQ